MRNDFSIRDAEIMFRVPTNILFPLFGSHIQLKMNEMIASIVYGNILLHINMFSAFP